MFRLIVGIAYTADIIKYFVRSRCRQFFVYCKSLKQCRSYLVNPFTCPTYADGLEQQIWAPNGEPDKSQGNDHANDGGGYFIHREYPIIKPVTAIKMGYAR